ncbi:MAG: hypothetical protein IIB77_14490 [Proteobacteria bacterium]|nr:hypothetical protein [Pseudomonadota bacterium]
MKDVMGPLRNWLAAQSEVSTLVGTRIFVNRVPRGTIEAEDTFHPQKMLVIRQAGGSPKADLLCTDDQAITVLCYGESDLEADSVRRAVWELFVNLSRVRQDGLLLYHVNPSGGAVPLVDPDIVWPGVAQNFTLKAAVL